MPSSKETRLNGHLGRGALLSLLLHAQLLVPLLFAVFVYAAREEAQRAEEVDVAFRDVSNDELPPDLPSLEDLSPPPKPAPEPPERDQPEKKPKEKLKPKVQPKQKLAEKPPIEPQPKPKPEAEVPLPPMPPMPKEPPPPPPPKPEVKGHEKMVDLDNDKDVEPPPDAKYLAQKNNRTDNETRATDTNLDKAQKGSEGSTAPSEREDQQVGDDKAKIAELQDVKSALGRKAPDVTPHTNPELSEEETPPTPKSLLALRNAARREHEITPETVDPSLPHAPDGDMALPDDRGVRGPRRDPARLAKGKRMKLQLSAKDYEYLFGADAEAERRLAQTERSKKVGRFQKSLDRMKSALENFIPEVKPGNQEALNTRAAPFAAFIARMHRSIHKLWGFGMLEEWDEKSGSNAFNNPNLLTVLELALNGDGTIDKVTVVRPSGYLPYDVAAIDVAYSAGPYPDPPREIRSKNGKIYVHWSFYRDARQCATSGVDYFILNNAPAGGDKGPVVSDGTTGVLQPRSAKASAASAAAASAALPPAPGAPPSSTTEEGPRHLDGRASESPAHRAKMRSLDREVAAAEESSPPPEPSRPAASPPRGDDPAATALARTWFDAFARGDVLAMLGKTVYPFRSNGERAAATSRGELATMLKALIDESPAPGRAVTAMQLYSAAGLRGVIGRLPPGMDDNTGLLFAVAQTAGKDTLILILAPRSDGWKAAGLARR